MTGPLTDANRNADLAAIHIAAHDLKMSDADYRLLMNERYGVLSASALKPAERADLLQEFERRGWKGRPGKRVSKQMWLVQKLLREGGKPEAYGHALAKRLCKVERLAFCRPAGLRKVIAALQYDAKRNAKPSASKGKDGAA